MRSEAKDDPGKTNGTDGRAYVWINGLDVVASNMRGYHVVVLDAFTGEFGQR